MTEEIDQAVRLLERVGASALVADRDGVVRARVGGVAASGTEGGDRLAPEQLASAVPVGDALVWLLPQTPPLDAVASLGHELRAPVNAVLGMAELLSMSTLDSSQRRHLELLTRAATGLHELLERLLRLQALDAGREELQPRPFHLHDVLDAVLDLFAVKAQRRGTELGVVVDESVALYRVADDLRLRQVLTNLVGNALKHTVGGRVVVRVRNARGSAEALEFRVEDTGAGVPEERRSRLFAPFWQLDRAAGEGGVGLGLAISRALVEGLGGTLSYEAGAGGGSVFRFDVHAPAQSDPDRVTRPVVTSAPRVIVWEDRPLALEAVSSTLAARGVRVTAAVNVAEVEAALALEPEATYSIVASADLVRGRERELRTLLDGLRVPAQLVLVLSAAAPASEVVSAQGLGAVVVHRPVQRRRLLDAVFGRAQEDDATPAVARRRVLVCDDAEEARLFAQAVLMADGHAVDVVATGPAALDAMRDVAYDVALVDVEMPGMNGVDVLRALEAPVRERTHIIACTGHARPEDARRLLAAGFDEHLAKPLTRATLSEAVRRASVSSSPESEAGPSLVEARMALLRRDWEALRLLAARVADQEGRAELLRAVDARDAAAGERALLRLSGDSGPGERAPGADDAVRARLAALVPRFLAQREEDVAALRAALRENDFDRMRFIGHRIAGSAQTYGFPGLGVVGRELEQAAEDKDPAALGTHIAALEAELGRVHEG